MEQAGNEIALVEIDVNEFKNTLYSYYLEIFPKEERKSFRMIEKSYNKGISKIIKIVNDNNLVGFMILNQIKKNGYVILDYLAILPQYRDKGFGSKALRKLINQQEKNEGIFIEIEKIGLGKDEEENRLRRKRQKFYEELGFKQLKIDLILFDVIYMPYIYSNSNKEEEIIMSEIFDIYESICGRERIRQNCKIVKG